MTDGNSCLLSDKSGNKYLSLKNFHEKFFGWCFIGKAVIFYYWPINRRWPLKGGLKKGEESSCYVGSWKYRRLSLNGHLYIRQTLDISPRWTVGASPKGVLLERVDCCHLTINPEAKGVSIWTPLYISTSFYGYVKLLKATWKGTKSKEEFVVTPSQDLPRRRPHANQLC